MDERKKPGLCGLEPRRKAAGYTQEQLAAILGVSRQALSAWETGKTSPFAAQLPEIAWILGCSIGALFEAPEEAEKRAAGGGGPCKDILPEEEEDDHEP